MKSRIERIMVMLFCAAIGSAIYSQTCNWKIFPEWRFPISCRGNADCDNMWTYQPPRTWCREYYQDTNKKCHHGEEFTMTTETQWIMGVCADKDSSGFGFCTPDERAGYFTQNEYRHYHANLEDCK